MTETNTPQDSTHQRVVTIVHGHHRWRFCGVPGQEQLLVKAALSQALAGAEGLDLVDTVLLARQLDAGQDHPPKSQKTLSDRIPKKIKRTPDHASDE